MSTAGKGGTVAERIVALRTKAGDAVIPVGVVPYPDGPRHVVGAPGSPYDWVLLPLRDDPLFQRRELAIPIAVRTKLRGLDAAGVHFDDLLIAHEVPRGLVGTAGHKTVDVAEAIVTAPVAAGAASTLLGATVRGITKGMAATATAIASALPDPILFGVIAPDGTPAPGIAVAVFEIARW